MFIFDILIFIVILSIVVFVHELGHFSAAKSTGVKVEEFGIGFPPKIWQKKIGETQYFLGALPFGGYNKIYGMDEMDDEKDKDPKSYESKSVWVKCFICLNGVFMNLLLAVILFYFLVIGSGFKVSQVLILDDYKFPFGEQQIYPLIVDVNAGSPAAAAGLESRDAIVSVNGAAMSNAEQFFNVIDANLGKSMNVAYLDSQTKELKNTTITPRAAAVAGEGPIGVSLSTIDFISYNSFTDKALCGFYQSYNFIDYSFSAMGSLISTSIKEKTPEPLASSLTGPVGIFAVTKVVAKEGIVPLLNLLALLSIALGVSNLIPLPALDGAKFIYTLLQAINKKIFSKELLMKIEQVGMIVLIGLALLIVFKDFFQFKSIIFGA
jgi:regulator of sigma E protease